MGRLPKIPPIFCHEDKRWVAKFKLPTIEGRAFDETFRSKRKAISPYDKFHHWAAKKVGPIPKDHQIRVGAFWICKEDLELLKGFVREWIVTYHFPNLTKNAVESAVAWHNLDLGPACFERGEERPAWAKPGYVWVMEPVFVPKETDKEPSAASQS